MDRILETGNRDKHTIEEILDLDSSAMLNFSGRQLLAMN